MTECANVVLVAEVNPVVKISQPQESVVLINDAANVVDITCPETVAVIQQNATLVLVTEELTVPITETNVSVLIEEDITQVVSVGDQGPTAEDAVKLAEEIDFIITGAGPSEITTILRGEATPGSITSAAVWRIRRSVIESGVDDDTTLTWADGNALFDNVWDDRLALSFS